MVGELPSPCAGPCLHFTCFISHAHPTTSAMRNYHFHFTEGKGSDTSSLEVLQLPFLLPRILFHVIITQWTSESGM